jgi:ABC-2 type transport system ATP-binding protein
MTDAAIAIRVEHLSKTFGGGLRGKNDVQALADVSLEVTQGEIFGLLGPNGAGKTTFVKILLGALHPSTGSASINGHGCGNWRARQKAGFLPENHRFPSYLTGQQFLNIYGGLAGMPRSAIRTRANELLELVEMTRWRKTKIRKYSKGMMQRLGVAQALLNDPDLVFLDEPTDGVDPVGRREIREILKKLKDQGKTIFLNSHLLAEVEAICDRVAILDKGKLIKVGPVGALIETKPYYWIETSHLPEHIAGMVTSGFDQRHIAQI